MAQHAGVVRVTKGADQALEEQELQRAAEWKAIEQSPEFQNLIATKRSFILPATIAFIVYYFALPILVGYFPGLMSTNVIGNINVAYLFALSQFFMAWIIMALYVRQARVFDRIVAAIVAKVKGSKR